jgi:hypothetical protein
MHKLVALLALCALTAAAAAQTISLDFDSIPVGTRATDIELPGINIWEDDPRFTGGIRSGCHWVVVDLATLVQSTAAPGVEMAPPKHSSGNVLACVNQHEPCTPSYAICDGSLLATDLYIESTSTLASADVVIGGLGCLNDGGYGGQVDQRECSMNVIPGTVDPRFGRDTDGSFSLKDLPGLDVDAPGHVSKSRRFTWVVFGGYGFVGSHRYPATTALFIDKLSLNLESPTDCGPPGPVRFEPPFDQHNEAIPVTAGDTVRVAWKPFSFPANVSYRRFTAFMFPVPYGFRYIGTVNVPETTTVVDFMIPRRYVGDYTARLNVWPAGSCEGRGWWPNPSYFGPLLQVHDPAPPPRVDSVVPRFAKPGAVVDVRGDGFVIAGLTVTVGGKSADRILVDNQLMRVTVPQLDDGPAEITVTTAYGTVTVPPSSGLFIVGTSPPRRHPVRR